jgi:hypothetical protein|tara:strand:- start:102 stop:629 length:528 start_codon:yes stop_codon:yes gene_type:complete
MSLKFKSNANELIVLVDRKLSSKIPLLNKEIDLFLKDIIKDAKTNIATNKSIDSNSLINSMKISSHNNIKISNKTLTVDSPYGAFVEFGTKSRANPPSSLTSYASNFKGSSGGSGDVVKRLEKYLKSKGFTDDEVGALTYDILVNGTRPHPFFFPAIWKNRKRLRSKLIKILNNR